MLRSTQAAAGQPMAAGRHHDHGFAAGLELDQVRPIAREVAQAECRLAAPHQVGDFRARGRAQFETHLAGLAGKAPQRVDDVGVGQGSHQRERDGALQACLQIAHRILPIFQRRQRRLGVRQEGPARFSEPGAAANPLEQLRAKLEFELVQAATDCGLRSMQALSGAREASGLGDGQERADFLDVHGSEIRMLSQRTMHFTKHSQPLSLRRAIF